MKNIFKSLLLFLVPLSVAGQLTPLSNQYILNPLLINPAYAGGRGAMNIATFYRQQWTGIDGAPRTLSLAMDAPLPNAKLGLGLLITNDRIGVTKETSFNTNYAYKLNLRKGILSLGLGAGLITTNTAWSDLVVIDPGDDFYLIDSRIFVVPDFSFGMYYTYQNYFAGFSIPKLVGYRFDFVKNGYSLIADLNRYDYLFNTGFVFNIGTKARFFPSTLIIYSPQTNLLYDANVHFSFFDKFWIGASYRNDRSITGLFQFHLNNQLKLAYSYDFDIGHLSRYSNGSHEIMLRYEFRYKLDVINPLIF